LTLTIDNFAIKVLKIGTGKCSVMDKKNYDLLDITNQYVIYKDLALTPL
jgi:hypothetical protein